MKQQLNEIKRMQRIAGLITESEYQKSLMNEALTADELYKEFEEEDLLNDRREYDVEDLMLAYPGLSKKEAEKLKQMLQSGGDDLAVKWTKRYLDNEKKDPYFYNEKGLLNGFEMVDGKKVKEIIGYFDDTKGDEDSEVIGYVYSKSGKDIETEYNKDDLDNAFTSALKSIK